MGKQWRNLTFTGQTFGKKLLKWQKNMLHYVRRNCWVLRKLWRLRILKPKRIRLKTKAHKVKMRKTMATVVTITMAMRSPLMLMKKG